jgi:hypothetical protein
MNVPGCFADGGDGVATGTGFGCGVGDPFTGGVALGVEFGFCPDFPDFPDCSNCPDCPVPLVATLVGAGAGVDLVIWGVGLGVARWVSGGNGVFASAPVFPGDLKPADDHGVGLGSGLDDAGDVRPMASASLLKNEGRAPTDLGRSSPGALGVGVGRTELGSVRGGGLSESGGESSLLPGSVPRRNISWRTLAVSGPAGRPVTGSMS